MRLGCFLGSLASLLAACVAPPTTATVPDAQADGQAQTVDAGPCGDLPSEGRCEGDHLLRCHPATGHTDQDCTLAGGTCLAGDGVGPRCGAPPSSCADLATGDLCGGDRLYFCHGGWLLQVACDSLGGRCSAPEDRPGCSARPGGTAMVTGRITRDHREALPEGLSPLGSAPAAGLTVTVLDAEDEHPLGLGTTDAEGRVTVPIADPGSRSVKLRVIALGVDGDHRLWVADGEDAAYAAESAPAPVQDGGVDIDMHLAEEEGAGGFHIFEVLRGLQGDAAARTNSRLPALEVVWEQGQLLGCGTCFSRYPETIFVSGDATDTDEYDSSVLGHEFGHYFLWVASRDDSPGGEHDGLPTDPRLAWSEGAASWTGLALLGQDLYIDTMATGALVRDPVDLGVRADPDGGLDQDVSEHVVLEVLWGISEVTEWPDVPSPRSAVLDVLTAYLPSAALTLRGYSGVDLVEFLDGWICRGHGDEAILGPLVEEEGFPYDFGGPAPPCPKPKAPYRLELSQVALATEVRVTVTVESRSALRAGRVLLKGQLAHGGAWESSFDMPPLEAGETTSVSWSLPPHLDLEWVAAGLEVPDGGGAHHASAMIRGRALARPTATRIDLGGLLRLRVAGPVRTLPSP